MLDETFMTEEEKKALKREKERKRDSKLGYIIAVLLFGGCALWSLGFGIYGLFMAEHKELSEAGNGLKELAIYEGDVSEATKCYCVMEHTISGLIPYAHEYYYLICLEDEQRIISVRAGKHWAESFTGENSGVVSIPVKGQARSLDYEVENRLKEVLEYTGETPPGYQLETDFYIDLISTRLNVLKIIVGIGGLIILVACGIYTKELNGESASGKGTTWITASPAPQILLVLFVVFACLALYVMSVA